MNLHELKNIPGAMVDTEDYYARFTFRGCNPWSVYKVKPQHLLDEIKKIYDEENDY